MSRQRNDHDLTVETMFRPQSPLSVALAIFTLLLLLLVPHGPHEIEGHAVLQGAHEQSKRIADYGYPDQFFSYHAAIRGIGDGPGYPSNYVIEEFRKALAARKHPGRQLDWVERGPANVPGRTRALIVDPDDPSHRTWYVGSVSGGLWKTVDAGEAWQSLTDHLPNLAVSALAMAPSDHDIIYMGTGEGFRAGYGVGGSGIFKSTDRGRTWHQLRATISKNLFGFVNRIIIDPSDANVVLAATNDGIYRSASGGARWNKEAPGHMYDLKARPDNFNVQFATHRGVISRSTDGGRTWEVSLDRFRRYSRRIELAIASSNPDVVYALADATGGPLLYRSEDSGASWELVWGNGSSEGPDWTEDQGTYNLAIGVHPYNENQVYMGGIQLYEGAISRGSEPITYLSDLEEANTSAFLWLFRVPGADYFGNTLLTGHTHAEVQDITPNDFVTVEWRFGPERKQKAHRFSVSRTAGSAGIGGPDVALSEHRYEDYKDVPFEVWDTENNRQLMVSFRDQADDGEFNLAPLNYSLDRDEATWEHVFIHSIPYDSSGADERIAKDGGVAAAMLYMLWPILPNQAVWNPSNLPESVVRITAKSSIPLELDFRKHPASNSVHVDHHVIHTIPIDETQNLFTILNANDGGVYLSENSGESFRHITGGYNTTQFYGVGKRPGFNQFIAGSQDNGTWRSDDEPDSRQAWMKAAPGDGIETVWHAEDDNLILASSQYNNIWRSTNSGMDWTAGGAGLSDVGAGLAPFLTQFGYSSKRPNRVFMIGGSGVWRSVNFGESWESVPIPRELWYDGGLGSLGSGRVRVSLSNPDIIWAGIRLADELGPKGTIHVSTDGGNTFEPAAVPDFVPHAPISGLATHPIQDSTAYVLFSRSDRPKILRSTDLGQTWTDLSGFHNASFTGTMRFPNVAVYDLLVMPHDPETMWAGTEIGIFESTDAGRSWLYSDNGLPAVSVWQMRIIDDQIVVATYGRGIWTLDVSEVRVNAAPIAEVPAEFILEPNYPNPFNPTTTIGFQVPHESHIRIIVFDVLGRKMTTLVDQPYAAGTYNVDWNAANMASGQYFYRLEVDGGATQTRSMMLVK